MRFKLDDVNALKITLDLCANSEGAISGNFVYREVPAG
jgi:hypothetical protein